MPSMRMTRGLAVAGLLAASMATAVTPALADPMRLRIQDGVNGVGIVVTDNGPGDGSPDAGIISVTPALGGVFAVTVAIGTSVPPAPGSGANLSVTGVVLATGPGILRLMLENDDYTYGTVATASFGGVLQGLAGSTVHLQSWLNPDNLVPDLGADVSVVGPLGATGAIPAGSISLLDGTFGPAAFAADDSVVFANAGTYSLFAEALLTFTASGGIATFSDAQSVATAAQPAASILLGGGLIGIAALRLIRRRRPA